MPLIEVKVYEHRVTPEMTQRIIGGLTDALSDAIGEDVREATWVIVDGVPPESWGVAGRAIAPQ